LKLSKDSDCSLVSSKNFSKILSPNSWHPGPGKVGQGGLKVFHLWRHSQKNYTPQAKNFFWVQTRRLAASFDASTRFVTCTGAEIFLHKPRAFKHFFPIIPESGRTPKCSGVTNFAHHTVEQSYKRLAAVHCTKLRNDWLNAFKTNVNCYI